MKNILLVLLTFLTFTAHGQNHLLGVKAGMNRTNVTTANFPSDNNSRSGLAIGLTYDYLFKKHFSAGADIIYNQFGFTNDMILTDQLGNPTGEKATTKSNYDYLTIPLKIGFNYGKSVYGFTNIALTPAFIVDAKNIVPTFDSDGNVTGTETFDTTSRVNKFDIGGLVEIGGGYKFKGKYWLFTSISYQHSFTSITNSDHFAESTIRHRGMALNIGLKSSFNLKRISKSR